MFFNSPLAIVNGFVYTTVLLSRFAEAQSTGPSTTAASVSSTTSYRSQFTVPAGADIGTSLLPNINDPEAVDAQQVCPGYEASNLHRTDTGITAQLSLAGEACNVYGNDVHSLNLTVQYQAKDRLAVNIQPTFVGPKNASWFILPDYLVAKPQIDDNLGEQYGNVIMNNDLGFFWDNEPTFTFSIVRMETGDVLFSMRGKKLVYEDQFIEFVTALPENYNLYGLGETMHRLRLGNNLTRTIHAADVGNPINYNQYGSHTFYLDTRYYEVDNSTGSLSLVTSNETDVQKHYVSRSHGLYNRNSHGQEILLRSENLTWRSIGGSIDLYFYSGPTAMEAQAAYNKTIGLPAMQQYYTFGFHQCRWGYANWSQVKEVVDTYARFDIPLESIWTDIDYMNQYRNFDNDKVRFGYEEGAKFFDSYATFDRGNATGSYLMNEASSYCVGSCGSNNISLNPVHPPFSLPGEAGALVLDYPEGFSLTNATEAASASSASSSQAAATTSSPETASPSYLRTSATPGLRNINPPSFDLFNLRNPYVWSRYLRFRGKQLCSRWMQMSAFFPFYRNHNTLSAASQEAYVWESVIDATKTAMALRFRLLPYMYTLFQEAHTTGSNVMRALAWEFPDDPSLANADRQFFLGPAILVTSVLNPNSSTVDGIFPGKGKGEEYYDWYTQMAVNASVGQNVTITAPLGHIPVFVRGGHVLAMQEPALTTFDARRTPWSILVALSLEGKATGQLYLDDGESIEPNSTMNVNFAASETSLYATARGNYVDGNPLANVTILGVSKEPGNVTWNGASVGSVQYNSSNQRLVVSGLQNATTGGAWAKDWVLRW